MTTVQRVCHVIVIVAVVIAAITLFVSFVIWQWGGAWPLSLRASVGNAVTTVAGAWLIHDWYA